MRATATVLEDGVGPKGGGGGIGCLVGREAMELAGLGLELDHPVRSCMNAMVRRVIRLGCVLLVRMLCFTSTVFFFYDESFLSSLCILYM